MSPRTKFLSKLIGFTCILLPLAMAVHRQATLDAVTALLGDAPALFILGLITVISGLAMVIGHNVWSGGAPTVLVTVVGWLALIKGLFFLLLPPASGAGFILIGLRYSQYFYLYMGLSIALGVFLVDAGVRRR
jgi:hypothetical protein